MSKFRKPENWNKAQEGTGYILYTGANDWENSSTACWAVFPSDESNRRIWFTIRFTEDCIPDSGDSGGYTDENREKCKKHAEKAWRTWLRVAKEAHRNRNHGSRSWLSAFKTALYSKEMKPFVDEHGEEQTGWSEVKESAVKTVEALLEDGLDDPERYIDQAGYRTFEFTFDYGAGEEGLQFEMKVPRHLLVGLQDDALIQKVIDYAKTQKQVPEDDWTWCVEVWEHDPVDPETADGLVAEALDDVDPERYVKSTLLPDKNAAAKTCERLGFKPVEKRTMTMWQKEYPAPEGTYRIDVELEWKGHGEQLQYWVVWVHERKPGVEDQHILNTYFMLTHTVDFILSKLDAALTGRMVEHSALQAYVSNLQNYVRNHYPAPAQ